MPIVKVRWHGQRPSPQRIRLDVLGWGGAKEPRADGNHEQAWHCIPFSEYALYGLDIVYPFDDEMRVTSVDGRIRLDADWGEPPDDDTMWPPFRTFGEDYYSYQLSLDVEVPPRWAIRTESHPRYFTNATNTTALAVPALIRSDWWPMTFSASSKHPRPA